MTFRPHPRLHVLPEAFDNLKTKAASPSAQRVRDAVSRMADEALDIEQSVGTFDYQGHNAHLIRARLTQRLSVTLAVQYRLTDDPQYKAAAMRYVQLMHDWEYWSWITWRQNNPAPDAIFDLSYGENSTTLAILHDWLHDSLTDADKQLFLATAQRPISALNRSLTTDEQGLPKWDYWWFKHAQSNWNTVCAGGAGMLALSLHELLPAEQAEQILQLAEASITPYMKQLEVLHGAWPEGIGYWNYGMRYAFMYLLSHENATGQPHWALQQPATMQSLHFPMDFCPNGVPCSFGDVNRWQPLPFHELVARRCGETALANILNAMLWHTDRPLAQGAWPNDAETLLLLDLPTPQADAPSSSASQPQPPFVKRYQGQDWGLLADRPQQPSLYMAVRGGTTDVPHGHQDLTSFHAVVGSQPVIYNQGVNEYLDTTFSPRRKELYDTTPASKNVLLVGGVGITASATVTTREARLSPDIAGLVIDAASAMGTMRDGPAVRHYMRGYFIIASEALLVLDHILLPQPNRLESRLHTPMTPAHPAPGQFTLQHDDHHAQIHLAASAPATTYQAMSLSTTPQQPVHVLRWIIDDLLSHAVLATLIIPSSADSPAASVTAACAGDAFDDGVDLQLSLPRGRRELRLTGDLTARR